MTDPCTKRAEIDKIMKAIWGNGDPGMKTDLALIKDHLSKMPSAMQLKIYAFLGAGAFISLGFLADKFIK